MPLWLASWPAEPPMRGFVAWNHRPCTSSRSPSPRPPGSGGGGASSGRRARPPCPPATRTTRARPGRRRCAAPSPRRRPRAASRRRAEDRHRRRGAGRNRRLQGGNLLRAGLQAADSCEPGEQNCTPSRGPWKSRSEGSSTVVRRNRSKLVVDRAPPSAEPLDATLPGLTSRAAATPCAARGSPEATRRAATPAPTLPGARTYRRLRLVTRAAAESRAAVALPARARRPAWEPSTSLPGALPRLRSQLRAPRRSCPDGGCAPNLRASRPTRRPCCKAAQIHGYLPAWRPTSAPSRLGIPASALARR